MARVVMKLRGNVLLAVYSDLEATAVDLAGLAVRQPDLLVETMDLRIKEGTWRLLGRCTPTTEVAIPVYMVQVGLDGDYFERMIDGTLGDRLTPAQADTMRRQVSFSPAAVELAVRASRGLAPWLPRFDLLKITYFS